MNKLVRPHGCQALRPLLLTGKELTAERERARTLKQLPVSSRERGDLIMLGIGGFTPLDGFMSQADWKGVCDDYRLANGLFWPIPITLSADTATASGIAIGTGIGYAVGAWMTWRVLRRGVKDLRLERNDVRLDRTTTWRIARVGIPNFFEGVTLWAVNLFVMAFIGMISVAEGLDGMPREGLIGAHMIAVQWEAFSFLPGFAMGTAAGALAGQFLGAGSASKARTAIWRCNVVGMAIMGGFGVAFMTLGEPLTRIISEDPVHLREVPSLLFICGLIQVFFAMAMVIRNGIRGAGDTTWVLAITFVSCYVLRLPLAWLLGVKLGKGLTGIWIGLCTELAVRGLLFLARFLHGGWARAKV